MLVLLLLQSYRPSHFVVVTSVGAPLWLTVDNNSSVGGLLESLSGDPPSNPTPGAGHHLPGGPILWRALATPTSSASLLDGYCDQRSPSECMAQGRGTLLKHCSASRHQAAGTEVCL